MDVMVFLALGAAAGVIVLLFLLTKLIRSIRADDEFYFDRPGLLLRRSKSTRADDEFDFDRPRLFPRRSKSTRSRAVPVAQALEENRPDVTRRVAAFAPTAVPAQVSEVRVPSERSVPVKQSGQSKVENARGNEEQPSAAESETHVEESHRAASRDYGRLGEQVTAVLTTAENAAAEIHEAANRDAEAIRVEAAKHAATARAEAEALRADADAYREETRAAADTYVKETRQTADAEAGKARAALEEAARSMRAKAERTAEEIEAEALRRRDALMQTAAQLEERIAEMLTTFRGMTTDLEQLLPREKQRDNGEPQGVADDVAVDDTLEDALKPERAASG